MRPAVQGAETTPPPPKILTGFGRQEKCVCKYQFSDNNSPGSKRLLRFVDMIW